MKKAKNICPVCGYAGLDEPAYDINGEPSFEICSCCGFEFGFDDHSEHKTFEEYRREWISGGAKWENEQAKPASWDLDTQLNNIKTKQRLFEEKVIKFFVDRIPEIDSFVKDSFEYCDTTQSVGMYIILPDIVRYLTQSVQQHDYKKAKEFFRVYNDFYHQFADEYHLVVPSDTIYNLNAVELFEIIDGYTDDVKDKIIPLMSKELQAEYKAIY